MKLLFIIYMCLLIYVVFFAEAMGRTPQGEYVYNLVPLREIKRFWKYIFDNDTLGSIARLNIFGNIIAFVPFGSCDVDDIILNTIGGVIGYILWSIYRHIKKG